MTINSPTARRRRQQSAWKVSNYFVSGVKPFKEYPKVERESHFDKIRAKLMARTPQDDGPEAA